MNTNHKTKEPKMNQRSEDKLDFQAKTVAICAIIMASCPILAYVYDLLWPVAV